MRTTKRISLFVMLAAGIGLCSTAWAQEVIIRGRVETANTDQLALTLRQTGGSRTLQVAPSAFIVMNGRPIRLGQIPINSLVSVIALKDPGRQAHAIQIRVLEPSNLPTTAGSPVGSTFRGTVMRVDLPSNAIVLRTLAGDVRVPLGHAPIFINGRRQSAADIRIGDRVYVEREFATEGSERYITRKIIVTERASVAGYRGTTRSGQGGARR